MGETCQEVNGLRAQIEYIPLPVIKDATYRVSELLAQSVTWSGNVTSLPLCFYDGICFILCLIQFSSNRISRRISFDVFT